MAENILQVIDRLGKLVVDSRLVAEALGIDHHNFLATLYEYQTEAEQAFGVYLFETDKLQTDQREAGLQNTSFSQKIKLLS